MMVNFLAPLGVKIFGGLSIFLLVVLAVMGFKLHHANVVIEHDGLVLKAVTAERDRYRDALAFFVKDGILRENRGVQMLKDHESVSVDLQRQATKIRTRTVTVTGKCATPKEVMGASGL